MGNVYCTAFSGKSRIPKGLPKNRKAYAQKLEESTQNEDSVRVVVFWVIFFSHFQNCLLVSLCVSGGGTEGICYESVIR